MEPVGMGDSTVSQSSGTDQRLSVAGWTVDPSTLRISKDGRTAKLGPLIGLLVEMLNNRRK